MIGLDKEVIQKVDCFKIVNSAAETDLPFFSMLLIFPSFGPKMKNPSSTFNKKAPFVAWNKTVALLPQKETTIYGTQPLPLG